MAIDFRLPEGSSNEKAPGPLSKSRAKLLGDHFFALDLDIQKANEELRKLDSLSYDQLKALSWAEDFTRLTFRSSGSDQLIGVLKTRDEDLQGWEVIAHHLGQEIIDSINANLFQAIVANDFDALIKAIEKGALINANDRFGHTPLHFTAYKEMPVSSSFFCKTEAIRTQGGDMTRPLFIVRHGEETSRPWKSFWRKARTSTPEPTKGNPGMTAALRGEKEILEILFALSADPTPRMFMART